MLKFGRLEKFETFKSDQGANKIKCNTCIRNFMRIVELKFLKAYNKILAILLTCLGFAVSCGKMEYGTPTAKFIVKGKVESSETNQPIQNIRVYMQGDSTSTDSAGHYQIINSNGFPENPTFPIRFIDLDGNLHGEFNNLDTVVEFKNPQFINGDGHWYNGETSKEFNIQLKPKK